MTIFIALTSYKTIMFSHTNLRSKINKTYDAFMWYILIEFDPVEIASSFASFSFGQG